MRHGREDSKKCRRQTEEKRQRTKEDIARWSKAVNRREQDRKLRAEKERQRHFKELVEANTFMNHIDRMSGIGFERFMADFFRIRGYSEVRMPPGSGDQGVDLVLTAEDRRIVVQLKRQVNPVGNAAVQAVFTGMIHYKADEAWVVTTSSSFTKKAKEVADSTGVRLYGRGELHQWLREPHDE